MKNVNFSHVISLILLILLPSFSINAETGCIGPISYQDFKEHSLTISDVVKDDAFLTSILNADNNQEFRVFLEMNEKSDRDLLPILSKDIATFSTYGGVAVSIRKNDLLYLIENQKISEVWNNSILLLTDNYEQDSNLSLARETSDYINEIGASSLWAGGYYGNNTRVAILDSGILQNHPALNQTMIGESRIVETYNFFDNDEFPNDEHGHGTKVAGIVCSNGLYGYSLGVAPNCQLLVGKILTNQGAGTIESLISGLDWAIENNADVINLSVGKPVSDLHSPEIEAVDNAIKKGVVVTVSAGNSRGIHDFGYNDFFTILSPGVASNAITVGAVDNNGVMYEKSSSGPVSVNYDETERSYLFDSINYDITWVKPDLVAPGVNMNTTTISLSTSDIVSGTSYSTAVVSGLSALLIQKFPEKNPSSIKDALIKGAIPQSATFSSPFLDDITIAPSILNQGAGLINSTRTSDYLQSQPSISIWPIEGPIMDKTIFINSKSTNILHLFVNSPFDELSVSASGDLADIISISGIPETFTEQQYNLEMIVDTKDVDRKTYTGDITFSGDGCNATLSIRIRVIAATCRLLIDCFEQGPNQFYSSFGSMYSITEIAKSYGFQTYSLSRDVNQRSLHETNLNKYESIFLINPNSSSSINTLYSHEDTISLLDYLTPGDLYSGGALVILPSLESDLSFINRLITSFDIEIEKDVVLEEILDFSSYYTTLTNSPYDIEDIYIHNPFQITGGNSSITNLDERFIISDNRYPDGSLLILGNNVNMFQYSPYLFSPTTNQYDISSVYSRFGDNYNLLRNILYSSREQYTLHFEYKINNDEFYPSDIVSIKLNASNLYKQMPGWDFFVTLEKEGQTYFSFDQYSDFGNGSYSIQIPLSDFDVPPGHYDICVRSIAQTKKYEIDVLTKFSWGPRYIEFSVLACIIFLLAITKNQKKMKLVKEV